MTHSEYSKWLPTMMLRPKTYFNFLFPPVPKIFIEILETKVFILVLNIENRMKIG